MTKQLLDETIALLKECAKNTALFAETIDAEWGMIRSIEELVADDDESVEFYHKINRFIMKLEQIRTNMP